MALDMREWMVFVGTYNAEGQDGIFVFRFDGLRGALTPVAAVKARRPSFLALHPDGGHLYAVNEVRTSAGGSVGMVSHFALDAASGALQFMDQQPSLGTNPCHLSVDATGRSLLVANYGSGTLGVLPVMANGRLASRGQCITHEGSGRDPIRQKGPHAHSIFVDPSNCHALACDLGIDRVMVYRLDAAAGRLSPAEKPYASANPGAGPRHLAFSAEGRRVYVVNEMDSTLDAFTFDPACGGLDRIQTCSTLPIGCGVANSGAEVQVHPSGRFVYASNRGHDSIAVFAVDQALGSVTPLGYDPCGGRTPRNFALSPDGTLLLSACQDSDRLVVFPIDGETGRLGPALHAVNIPKPTCVKVVARRTPGPRTGA